ncbi:CoA pyrophosphatase [Apibacter raozihei]|uniref:NUDIX hydrolase n=1 Tax=Apibacter TaxID=1778601 RepID=UPI000FE3BFA2|nr:MULTISPECIES: CoA pyrophosphatase [Apibacter]
MNFLKVKDKLQAVDILPGSKAHNELSPPYRKSYTPVQIEAENPRSASVLIVVYEKSERLYFPLILRTVYEGVHSGQIGLPGGKREKDDLTQADAALRETFEELGLIKEKMEIVKKMTPLYIPPSNFYVHPYIAIYHEKKIEFLPDKKEVQQVYEIDISQFLYHTSIVMKSKYNNTVPAFIYNNLEIWGATAMILNEFRVLLKSDIFTGF